MINDTLDKNLMNEKIFENRIVFIKNKYGRGYGHYDIYYKEQIFMCLNIDLDEIIELLKMK